MRVMSAAGGEQAGFEEALDVPVVGVLVDRLHPQVEAGELRGDHRDGRRVQGALQERLPARLPVLPERGAGEAEPVDALALHAARLQRGYAVEAAGRATQNGCRARSCSSSDPAPPDMNGCGVSGGLVMK